MRRLFGYGLLGLLAYAVFMVLLCPATILTEWVSRQLPNWSIQNAQGSAFAGTAQGLRLPTTQLESLSWQLRSLPLLKGRIGYYLTLTEPELRLSGTVTLGLDRQLRIAGLNGHLPLLKAISLAGFAAPPLNGNLEVERLELWLDRNGRPQQAQGLLRVLKVHTSLGNSLPLGDFGIELQTQDPAIVAVIQDQGGPLQFTGTLTLDPDGRYRFNGQAAVRDGGNRELYQALSLLGQPGGDGKWSFNFSGN
jgi:general secretion pathway protein N